ncbi:TPA: hypothetical protein JGU28_004567 [Salmonella enterica]|nr:hypothetical protein [Salmonella enterica]
MKTILRILKALKSFHPLCNNRVFRVFLGVAIVFLFGLTTQAWANSISSLAEGLLFEVLFLITFYAFIYLVGFSMIDVFSERIVSFHDKNNKKNIDKNPIKWFLKYRFNLSFFIKMSFNFWFIYICFIELGKFIKLIKVFQ